MNRTSRTMRAAAAALTIALIAGCEAGPELDTRTYTLENLSRGEVQDLLAPYVYADRPEAPGRISMAQGAVTVRETPDNLEKIERVLEEYDVPAPYIRLHFQLIRANGSDGADPAIAAVENQLRRLFQFDGYELMGEAVVTARNRSTVRQEFAGPAGQYGIGVRGIQFQPPGTVRLQEVHLLTSEAGGFETSVNIQPGQTVVLGSSRGGDAGEALIVTVRAELLEQGGG